MMSAEWTVAENISFGVKLLGGMFLGWMALLLARDILRFVARAFARRFIYPLESRLLQRLQDRATARAFGTTVEVVRIRRKADTGG